MRGGQESFMNLFPELTSRPRGDPIGGLGGPGGPSGPKRSAAFLLRTYIRSLNLWNSEMLKPRNQESLKPRSHSPKKTEIKKPRNQESKKPFNACVKFLFNINFLFYIPREMLPRIFKLWMEIWQNDWPEICKNPWFKRTECFEIFLDLQSDS